MTQKHPPYFIGAVLLLLAMIHLALNGQVLKMSYQRDDLKEKYSQLRRKTREMEIHVAESEELHRVEKIAREKLGMTDAPHVRILTMAGSSPRR